MVTGDYPVVDLLYLFWDKPSANGLDNVLVVTLAVETTVDSVIVDACKECLVIIVNDREILTFVILEDYNPVMGEYLAVIGD